MQYLYDVLSQLVSADTVSHKSNAAAMELLAEHLDGQGFSVRLQHDEQEGVRKTNLVAFAGPPEPDGLILSGHLDVVPFEDQPGWSRDPLRMTVEDDRIYGRGTTDMKGFIAQCLEAARRVETRSLERPIVFLFTSDEEVGCRGAERLVPALPNLLGDCPLPRLAWIGEPTSFQVFHVHKGIVAFEVRVIGVGGHSSVPEAGVNAIAVAAKAIEVIGAIQRELREASTRERSALFLDAPHTTLNLGTIAGGSALNMIADDCRFSLSYRPLPDEEPLRVYQRIREGLSALDPRDDGSPDRRASIVIGEPLVAPGLQSPRGTSLEAALFEFLDTRTCSGAPYCTDGGQFKKAGIDSLICGPGDLDQAHQPDESIGREAFERGAEIVPRVLERLCGARSSGREHADPPTG
jgi:acetylornithine deacetylase